jgi:hypothetical protein
MTVLMLFLNSSWPQTAGWGLANQDTICAVSSTACIKTSVPAVAPPDEISSTSLCDNPPTQGTSPYGRWCHAVDPAGIMAAPNQVHVAVTKAFSGAALAPQFKRWGQPPTQIQSRPASDCLTLLLRKRFHIE